MPEPIDYSLYLVTDQGLTQGRFLKDIIAAAIRGGVTCVQLREKTCSTREFIEQTLSIKELLNAHHIPLIINDRVDVALAVGADGVHLGQNDMPLAMAKTIVKDSMLIGISTHTVAEAVEAERSGADYIGVGAMFATSTKTDTVDPIGPEGLGRIRKSVKIPIVGIGGINAKNAGSVIQQGADGIAVVSAIIAANDPEIAAKELAEIVKQAKTLWT
jgi:thiamine-phosphate pyrophosphorylase